MRCVARLNRLAPFAAGNAVMIVALLLSGCGTTGGDFHLHSPERDKQGQALKEAWSKVDLKAQLDVPRQNLQKTLAEQLATEEEIWSKRRSVVAGQMAHDWTVEKFQTSAAAGLKRVMGTVKPSDEMLAAAPQDPAASAAAGAAKQYRMEAKNAQTEADNRDRTAGRFLILGVSAPTCEIVMGTQEKLEKYTADKLSSIEREDKAALFAGYISSMKNNCADLEKAKTAQRKVVQADDKDAPTGELGKALIALKKEEEALEKDKSAAELAAASLKALQTEYTAAEKALNPGAGAAEKERVERAIKKLKAWEADVGKLEANPLVGKLLSDVKLESLDKFLATYGAAASGKGTEVGSNRLAVALALVPDMQRKSDEAMAAAERPNLTPFVLRKNIEQARTNAARRDVERRMALIDLQRKIVATLEEQLGAYEDAYIASSKVVPTVKVKSKTGQVTEEKVRWAEVLQAVEAKPNVAIPKEVLEPKIAAWRASTRYLEAEGRMRADIGQTYYRIYALQYEGVLLNAESSIAQWKGLVDPSVDLLAQWGAAGVAPQDIVQLFNSLMLLSIAVGVN